MTEFRARLISIPWKKWIPPDDGRPRLSLLCVALALFAGLGSAFATWLALLPPAEERPGVTVAAARGALGACLSRQLRRAPELAETPDLRRANPLVSVLTHPGSESSRVVFEGSTRLSFVVTLTDTPDGQTETRLVSLPALDPGPAVARAVAACARRKG